MYKYTIFGIVLCFCLCTNCKKDTVGVVALEHEIQLGAYIDTAICNSHSILDTANYKSENDYVNMLLDTILLSDSLARANVFNWQIRIVASDSIQAIAVPGGYLYLYTGLLKQLNNGAQLTGLLAHLVAHIDNRHLVSQIEKIMGIDVLLSTIYHADVVVINNLVKSLLNENTYAYNTSQEYLADKLAMEYILETSYDPLGIKYFYENLNLAYASGKNIEFYKNHLEINDRIIKIVEHWEFIDSPTGILYTSEYSSFRTGLP